MHELGVEKIVFCHANPIQFSLPMQFSIKNQAKLWVKK